MPTVLITGASGFVGFHLIVAAITSGFKVVAAVRRTSQVDHLQHLPIQFIDLNFVNESALAQQLLAHNIEFVIHAAGTTKAVSEADYRRVNATFTYTLAKAVAQCGSQIKKTVVISSLAAVGPVHYQHQPITEYKLPAPLTAYGRSKLLAEEKLLSTGIDCIILRPTAIYGPREKDIFIILKAIAGGWEPYLGKVAQRLSFVYVTDVASLAVLCLTSSETGIFNITDGHCYDRYELANIVKQILHKKTTRFHLPMVVVKALAFVLEKWNGILKKPAVLNRKKLAELTAQNWCCNISKATEKLHFTPRYDLQKGLHETIHWYKTNKWM